MGSKLKANVPEGIGDLPERWEPIFGDGLRAGKVRREHPRPHVEHAPEDDSAALAQSSIQFAGTSGEALHVMDGL